MFSSFEVFSLNPLFGRHATPNPPPACTCPSVSSGLTHRRTLPDLPWGPWSWTPKEEFRRNISNSNRIVCTALCRESLITQRRWLIDNAYSNRVIKLDNILLRDASELFECSLGFRSIWGGAEISVMKEVTC